MRIENIVSEVIDGRPRVSATLYWEDNENPKREIYFETEEEFAPCITINPDAFLMAAVIPAASLREKRILIQGGIDPELQSNIFTVLEILKTWFKSNFGDNFPVIESRIVKRPQFSGSQRVTGSFLSGGIDSLAILRVNRLEIPISHPASISSGIIVYGFDIGGYEHQQIDIPEKIARSFKLAFSALQPVAKDSGISLIPVYTNIKHIYEDNTFWMNLYCGSALAAVAHSLSNQIRSVQIASSFPLSNLINAASHPLIDPYFSSSDLAIHHAGLRFSRFQKTKLIADWDAALHNIRVCTNNPDGRLNCGRCEKCLRTMLALIALGKLNQCKAFPVEDVRKELVEEIIVSYDNLISFYAELIEPLRSRNRDDLANAIQRKLLRAEEKDLKSKIKRFDRKHFNNWGQSFWSQLRTVRKNRDCDDVQPPFSS